MTKYVIHIGIKINEYQGEILSKENHQYDGMVKISEIIAPINKYIQAY